MIPIKKKLNLEDKEKYVSLVKSCMTIDEWRDFESKVLWIYSDIENKDFDLYKRLENELTENRNVNKDKEIYTWLTLEYALLEQIKNYLDNIYIQPNLNEYNKILSENNYKELKNYCDLLKRRKKKYSKKETVCEKLNEENDYDTVHSKFSKYKEIYRNFYNNNINNWIIKKSKVNVCPYCNLAYTYSRKGKVTAQLDHFFGKSEYPLFSLCYYNLIPCCPPCNHIKLDSNKKMASPYEENAFENMKFSWKLSGLSNSDEMTLRDLSNNIKINISSNKTEDLNNIEIMKLNDAYTYHKDYASEIIKKMQIYLNPDSKKLIQSIAFNNNISNDEIEHFYFGVYLDKTKDIDRILTKMVRDFMEEYKNMRI